jgi:DNA-binding response OmpR family regulator
MSATQAITLIVEDDASTREFLVRALEKKGMGTVQAASVGEALVALEREPHPSSVVLDLMLPDANGVVILRRIRRNEAPIRVAVVTGMADPTAFFDALKLAPDKIFKKPLKLGELIEWCAGEA